MSIWRFDNAPSACWRASRLRLRSALRSMVAWDFGAFGARGLAGTGVRMYGFAVVKALLLVDYGGIIYPPSPEARGEK